jgi:hypothetical protein
MQSPLFWGFFIKRIFIYDMLKRIPKSDISVRPFKAYKEWSFDNVTSVSSSVFVYNAYTGSVINNYETETIINPNGEDIVYYPTSIYGQLNAQFYNNKIDDPILRVGFKTNAFTIITTAKERNLGSKAKVISIPQIYVGDGIKRGSVSIIDGNEVYSDDGFGNLRGIEADLILESINFDNEQIEFLDLTEVLNTIQILEINYNSNLLRVRYNGTIYDLVIILANFETDVLIVEDIPFIIFDNKPVGNIFYNQGIIVITKNSDNVISSSWELDFKSTETIYEHEYLLIVNEDEFNVSQNPTAIINVGKETQRYITSDGKGVSVVTNPGVSYIKKKTILETGEVLDYRFNSLVNSSVSAGFEHWDLSGSVDSTGSFLTPFITTIGLYDDNCDLVAVAKLPQPIKSEPDIPINFIIRFDT